MLAFASASLVLGSGDSVLIMKMHNNAPYHITEKTWIAGNATAGKEFN